MLVVESHAVVAGKAANAIADTVVDVGHEVAFLYVEHLVEAVGDMEAQAVGVVYLV